MKTSSGQPYAGNDRQMNKHILVVDDDAHIRSILQEVLESEAYIVDTASDGLIALHKIMYQQVVPEVILLDLNLPRLNGLQLVGALLQHEEVGLDSIIVISGDPDALQEASRLGIHHCLVKPFDLETLLVLVSTCVA